ncbi:MAG: aryl-sulfate sulfotransferase [Deltaproteobacteria bacterium]|nr:aryl-sulfate sulfotransferase [Deltaproteobacteria bacterium]
MGIPTIYPTGTTLFDPGKCWSGYTLFIARETGCALVDMNGNVVHLWKGLHGFPTKLLPGGQVMGSLGVRSPKYGFMDYMDVVQVDWDGNVVWKFDQYEYIEDPGQEGMWMARQHHDYQREGSPVGYYAPGLTPLVEGGNTLILGHKDVRDPRISDKPLLDDVIYEVNWEGDIIWEWVCSEHFDEMDFSEAARNALCRNPTMVVGKGEVGDWMHMNSISTLGPNRWYDQGDERFHPDNIIWDGRQSNIIAVTDKESGRIVWQVGPDYDGNQAVRELGWIIGQHHAHMIPRGLPGEGNILVFDNGGFSGYGSPNPGAPTGHNNALRDYSRIIEFNPITLKVIWQYSYEEAGFLPKMNNSDFYSPLISSVQRLANGNTLITEGSSGRIFEVTEAFEIVWEYVSPYYGINKNANFVYRAYRVPYDWVPQLERPDEKEIPKLDRSRFRVPGSVWKPEEGVVEVEGTLPYPGPQLCVSKVDEPKDG